MQREGREGIKQQHNFEILFGAGSMAEQACESFLDQHTANTWKAAQESIRQEIALDLRETFMEDDGEDSYIQLTARIVLFIRKLEKQHD